MNDRDLLLTVFVDRPPRLSARPERLPSLDDVGSTQPPFVDKLRRQGTRRFIWSIDRHGRFASVSAPLAEVVGDRCAGIIGLPWSEVARTVVIDEGEGVARHLERRETWSDHTVLWRITDTSFVVPVELGGMPVFGRDRAFEGFRGFGLCRATEVRPGPVEEEAETEAVDRAETAHEVVASAVEDVLSPTFLGTGSGAFLPGLQASLTGQLGSLRPPPIRRSGGGGTHEGRPGLSVTERGALREIAKALGARLEEDEPPASPGAAGADIVSLPVGRTRDVALSRFADRVPAGIVVVRAGAPIFANRFLLDLLDYPDLRAMTQTGGIAGLFASGGLGETDRPIEPALPMTLRAASGEAVPVDVRLTTVEWGDGVASLLLIRPVPQRSDDPGTRALELDLIRRDIRIAELSAALDAAELGVVVIDPLGRVLSLSAAAERLFGYDQNEVAGESFTVLLAPESHRDALDLVTAARAGPPGTGPHATDLTGRVRDGGSIRLGVRAVVVNTSERPSVALTFRDLSGAAGTAAELNAAKRAADAAVARQTEFLARVSHEIRTPLNAILGFAEIMLEERFGPIGSERYRSYLRDVHTSGQHVVSLVGDLLDLAKVTSGKSELAFTALDLNEVLEHAVSLLQPLATREQVILRTGLAPHLPRIVADERSLRQIALNLVSNAIRFTPAGGQVIVSSRLRDGGEVAFRVRDTGVGMSPAELEAALEPFRQVSSTRRDDGTGLGLPLSKALVEANHGSLTLRSRPGEGALVEVLFPASRVLSD